MVSFKLNPLSTKGRYTRGVLLPEHAPGSFCTCQYTRGSVFKFAQFAPGACSQIFNLLNIVEHFAGWKFCSRGWSIYTHEIVGTQGGALPLEHAPGAKSLVCIGLKGDQHEISPYNINAFENRLVMRIEYMIREDDATWYFNKFSPPLLLKKYRGNKWESQFWY